MRIARVPLQDLSALRSLTFPAVYDVIRERFPSEAVAFAAYSGEDAVGLAIGVRGPQPQFEILSLFVVHLFRRQGIGALLLSCIEHELGAHGHHTGVHFLTVDPQDQAPVRFLMQQGWSRPSIVKLICRSTLANAFDTPWLVRAKCPDHHRIVPWATLTDVQREAVAAGVGTWVPEDLDPFGFEGGIDEITSVALIAGEGDKARVAGWVLTHRIDASTLRWSCSFVDPALQGSARILPLWLDVACRQRSLPGLENFVFTVPLTQPRMVRFATRYMRPWLTSLSYSCMTMKRLAP